MSQGTSDEKGSKYSNLFVLPQQRPKTAMQLRRPSGEEIDLVQVDPPESSGPQYRLSQSLTNFPPPKSKKKKKGTRDASDLPAPSHSPSLDIYANRYVPLWLKAVNRSYVSSRPCRPLEGIDFKSYIASFASDTFLGVLPPVQLPPPTPIALEEYHALTKKNFELNLRGRLQNECHSEAAQLEDNYIYNIRLLPEAGQQGLFRLSVPGLREGIPRIGLGDIVLLRPIVQPRDEKSAATIATAWYNAGAKSTFQFATGSEHHAVVFQLWRAMEFVVLRVEGYPTTFLDCNVIFTLQYHAIEPLIRAIVSVSHGLARKDATSNATTTSFGLDSTQPTDQAKVIPQNFSGVMSTSSRAVPTWLTSMLFPTDRDSVIQVSLPRGNFDLTWYDKHLNYEQQKAVNAVVAQNYGTVPYMISGPPGTGKTKTIVEATLQLLNFFDSPHLLLCAPSDPAADTLAMRLAEQLGPNEMFRLNSWRRTFAEVPDKLLPYTFARNASFSIPEFSKMMSFSVVVTTCRDAALLVQTQLTSTSLNYLMVQMSCITGKSLADTLHWDALLLDESAQSTEPEALIPLSVVAPPSGCIARPIFVLAGDEYQLGPRLACKSFKDGLQLSLFQRLSERDFYAQHPMSRSRGLRPMTAAMLPMARPAFTHLFRNYRSHPAILSVPSMLYYNDTLVPEKMNLSEVVRTWPGWHNQWPILFRQNASQDDVESVLVGDGTGAGGILNYEEATVALKFAQSLLAHRVGESRLHPHELMIMSPFRAQVKLLRDRFRKAKLYDVNIGPLEAFQGLESRIVVLCTTRTRLGGAEELDRFVRHDQTLGIGVIGEPKRFNVAVTRAKEGLIVIGNQESLTCTGDNAWKSFIAFCVRNGCVEGESFVEDLSQYGTIGRLEKALRYDDWMKSNEESRRKQGELRSNWMRGPMLSGDDAMLAHGQVEEEHSLSDGMSMKMSNSEPDTMCYDIERQRQRAVHSNIIP